MLTTTELSSCESDHLAHKAQNIYSLALECLLTLALSHLPVFEFYLRKKGQKDANNLIKREHSQFRPPTPTYKSVCVCTHPQLLLSVSLSQRKIFLAGPGLISQRYYGGLTPSFSSWTLAPAITLHLPELHSFPLQQLLDQFKIKKKKFSFGSFLAFFPRETDNSIIEPCPGKLLWFQTTESTARVWQFLV